MASHQVTRLELHTKILEVTGKSLAEKKDHLVHFLTQRLNLGPHEDALKTLREFIQISFLLPYQQKWEKCNRMNKRFLVQYNSWLTEPIHFPETVQQYLPCTSTSTGALGRPEKEFIASSDRSKRRKVQNIITSSSAAELALAASLSLREEGDIASAQLLTEVTTTTPTRAKRVLHKWRESAPVLTEMSPEEALSLMITTELTKRQYNTLRSSALRYGHELYPSYHRVLKAKSAGYPDEINITESMCEVNLQILLNHTVSRVLSCVSTAQASSDEVHCTFICKYGFDGSSGHAHYKQMWEKLDLSYEYLFMSCLVPLRLLNDATDMKYKREIIWANPRPSSTRFCRPIRLQWIKETKEIAKAERDYLQRQIDGLKKWTLGSYSVTFSLLLTMINGKVCNALTDCASMRCYICGAKTSEMNDIKSMKVRPVDTEKYAFGLSTLHCHIRFFECLLHISYRLDFKQWQARGDLKIQLSKKKAIIQKAFRERMGLIVDVPRPGSGTTNDGNTARRFFGSPKLAAELTGINYDLIRRFAVILKAISSGLPIKDEAFSQYCLRTAELYVELYPWYYMPTTVHKVLLHGGEISKEAILPLGQLSEEALEARNKDTRKFRERFTRKYSRVATNDDLFKRLLITSDPLLSSTMPSTPKNCRRLPMELRELLIIEDEIKTDSDDDKDSSED